MPHLRAADLVDVFAYVVVLALAVQFFPTVISESFLITLLTAVVLKIVLEGVIALKSRAVAHVKAADTTRRRVVAVAMLAVLLPGSKFLVLFTTDWVFGDLVSLGGFFKVTLLIAALIAARAGVRRLLV